MQSEYHAIASTEDAVDTVLARSSRRKRHAWLRNAAKFLLFEAVHLAIFLAWLAWRNRDSHSSTWKEELDHSYHDLHRFDSTEAFDLWGFGPRNGNMTLWDGIFPEGEGLVSVPRTSTLSASRPSEQSPLEEDHMIYQVGVFHHLHCLRAIKWALEGNAVPPLPGGNGDPMGHPLHCVDWLRQALTCNADLSLDATEDFWTFGQDSPHRCRDFGAVLAWTEKNRYRGSMSALREIAPAKLAPWLTDPSKKT